MQRWERDVTPEKSLCPGRQNAQILALSSAEEAAEYPQNTVKDQVRACSLSYIVIRLISY